MNCIIHNLALSAIPSFLCQARNVLFLMPLGMIEKFEFCSLGFCTRAGPLTNMILFVCLGRAYRACLECCCPLFETAKSVCSSP